MSENITHTAIVDDASRLARHSEAICSAFKSALAEYPDVARLGGITRWGDQFNPHFLTALRDDPDSGRVGTRAAEKLAFVLGWLSHRAADRQMKPVFREFDPDCALSPSDCSIYHDIFVYREVFGSGAGEPYSTAMFEPAMESHPGASAVDVATLESLFRVMWQRMLLAMHTFKPDGENIDAWLDNVIGRHQRLTVDIRRYAEAFHSPDPAKVDRFIVQPNFYDREEPLIVLARALQRGERPNTTVADALAVPAQSRYGLALHRACRYLHAASEYFRRQTDESDLRARLDIGKPELES